MDQKYENVEYHMFNAYNQCTDQVFHPYLTKLKDEYKKKTDGERSYTYDQIMKYAVNSAKFHLMVQRGDWRFLDDRLLALEETKTKRIPRKDLNKKRPGVEEGGLTSKYTPKGGNWVHTPPAAGGVDKKAAIIRKTRKGEKIFYWYHRKNGSLCEPEDWRTYKPFKSDELKAHHREKKQKNKISKGKNL